MPTKHLMIFTLDRLSSLVEKGEILPRYYNPGNLFERVTIVTCNWRQDKLDETKLQHMVGNAELEVVQFILPSPIITIGWRYIETWLAKGVRMLAPKAPNLIWSLNCFQHGQLGARVSKYTGAPMVVSLHGRWDVDERQNLFRWLYSQLRIQAEKETLQAAEVVIPVYADIIPYAKMRGARRIELIYNTINAAEITRKMDYRLQDPPRLLSVNRQVPQKDPSKIIKAIHKFAIDCQLEVLGNGPLHDRLENLVKKLGISDKVKFTLSCPNKEICRQLHEYDLFVSTCHYHGISKGTLEAAFAGLPIIINQRKPNPVTELEDGWALTTSDNIEEYGKAILQALNDEKMRHKLGESAFKVVSEKYRPQDGERRRTEIFLQLLEQQNIKSVS